MAHITSSLIFPAQLMDEKEHLMKQLTQAQSSRLLHEQIVDERNHSLQANLENQDPNVSQSFLCFLELSFSLFFLWFYSFHFQSLLAQLVRVFFQFFPHAFSLQGVPQLWLCFCFEIVCFLVPILRRTATKCCKHFQNRIIFEFHLWGTLFVMYVAPVSFY